MNLDTLPRGGADQLRRSLFDEAARRFTLENGLCVLHREESAAQLVSVQVWVRTGSVHEGRWLGTGLSHFLEHMVFKGTARRPGGSIAREVQERGGSINAYTTFDRTVYHVDLPAEHVAFGLDLMADMVFSPSLDEADAISEMDVIRREIDMGRDDPDRRLSRALFETAYRAHPYRLPVIGRRALFDGLTGDDLRAYHRERYHPDNAVLIVTGAVSPTALDEILEGTFKPLTRRPLIPVVIPPEPAQLARRTQRLTGDFSICRGSMAFRIPGLAHPDAAALDLLAAGLGQGQSSHLWQTLREGQAVVHEISSAAWNPGESGLFWFSYLCDPSKREVAEERILQELANVAEHGLPEAVLEKVRRNALVSEIDSRKTVSGLAARLGLAEVVIGDLDYPREYLERLEAVTVDDLRRVAERYFNPSRLTQVTLNQADADGRALAPQHRGPGVVPFQVKTLANGARLVWQRDPRLPKVHLRFSAQGGALYETAQERGATALLATLLTRATQWRSAAEVAEVIERKGGHFSEFAGNNSFGLTLEVLSQDLGLARSILQDALLAPAFEDAGFARERDAQLAEIKERQDDVVSQAHVLLRERFFGEHPFGIDVLGTLESVASLTADKVRALHQRLLVGSNAVLVVAGDIDESRDLPLFEALLQDLPEWAFRESSVPFLPGGVAHHEVFAPREQAVVLLAFPERGVRAADELCGQLLQTACGDMSSELFRRVREERSLAYFVSTHRMLGLETGQFVFYAGTHPDHAAEVLDAFREEARRLAEDGLTPDEFERARVRMKGRMRMGQQSSGARAGQACLNILYGLPIEDCAAFDARVDALTIESVRGFAERSFDPARGVSLVLGPGCAGKA